MICPVHKTELIKTKTKYGDRFACSTATCTVACWSGSTSTPADAETRRWRHRCHKAFDPLWKRGSLFASFGRGGIENRRRNAYSWLASRMALPINKTHFGMFTLEQCRKALRIICEKILASDGLDKTHVGSARATLREYENAS